MPELPPRSDRRAFLALALGATGLVAGCTRVGDDRDLPNPTCVARAELDRHGTLGKAKLVYDINQRATTFSFDSGFYAQLGGWLEFFLAESGLASPTQIWTYGSWIDGGAECDSWHDSGRAFDLSRMRQGQQVQVSCRYDIWKDYAADQLAFHRRRYWALAASLHHEFAYVLTYLYNAQHHNHIHIDNGISGPEKSIFNPKSAVQVQAVQAICTYLWDKPLEITSDWDAPTKQATEAILEQLGAGELTDSADVWRAFLVASIRRGFS